jgi:hypothetical protein
MLYPWSSFAKVGAPYNLPPGRGRPRCFIVVGTLVLAISAIGRLVNSYRNASGTFRPTTKIEFLLRVWTKTFSDSHAHTQAVSGIIIIAPKSCSSRDMYLYHS